MATFQLTDSPGAARRTLAATLALVGTLVWTHALAAGLRAAVGLEASELAPASLALTLGAAGSALAGCLGRAGLGRATLRAGLVALLAAGGIAWLRPTAFIPALALVPAACAFARSE